MRTFPDPPIPLAVELRRSFRAPAERVFRAWTQPAALREWWCPPGWAATAVEIDLRVGGAYSIAMRRTDGPGAVAVRGRFIEIRPPERLVFTWRWEGAFPDSPEAKVVIELRHAAGITELMLRHEQFADDGMRHLHWSGWLAACGRLDRLLEEAAG
ncbi:MAG TPA: SRPBCC domain-containing protein [Stellaceae bacterium]|nr:SRPBCC domain-containing protein [Stellaceae bacterium]